jgi:hypothetical protein
MHRRLPQGDVAVYVARMIVWWTDGTNTWYSAGPGIGRELRVLFGEDARIHAYDYLDAQQAHAVARHVAMAHPEIKPGNIHVD